LVVCFDVHFLVRSDLCLNGYPICWWLVRSRAAPTYKYARPLSEAGVTQIG